MGYLFQVVSDVDKAREKIDTIGEKAKEQFQNWKRLLSGALNDPQLILALSVLFILYVFLTFFNSIIEGNSQERNFNTCECPILHRVFYQTVTFISLSIWFLGFLLITIRDAFKCWRYCYKSKHPEKYQPSSETQERAVSNTAKENQSEALRSEVANTTLSGQYQDSDAAAKSAAEDLVDVAKQELLSGKAVEFADSADPSRLEKSINVAPAVQENSSKASANVIITLVSNQGLSRSSLQEAPSNPTSSLAGNEGRQADTGIMKTPVESLSTTATQLTDDATIGQLMPSSLSESVKKEQSQTKKKHSSSHNKEKTAKQSQTKPLSSEDQETLKRIKHYENFLWMEFYKVYSVGATVDDESHTLPSFVNILEQEGETDIVVSETRPLLQPSYDGAAELPTNVSATNSSASYKEIKAVTSTTRNTTQNSPSAKQSNIADENSSATNTKSQLDADAKSMTPSIKSITNSVSNDSIDFLERYYPDTTKTADTICASVGFFLYPFLIVVRLSAQLALVPLLLFQVLGEYSWICITGDVYCRSTINQYRFGLDMAALGFTFYCCMLVAILSTTIIRWFPCSKDARAADANCIM